MAIWWLCEREQVSPKAYLPMLEIWLVFGFLEAGGYRCAELDSGGCNAAVDEQSREPSFLLTTLLAQPSPSCSARMNKVKKSHGGKHKGAGSGGGISRMLRRHTARLYIIRQCVVMLLCYHD
ncbi:hypothetical protein VPH35_049609 [Triticum aestivum]|uniref:Uncharacterized protein n=2 Tax=Triticum TaxID=4564 RepID=A0A9R1RZX3_TRITD|nr:unnamed protein product [Triticum aestivum]VAH75344.1 unnamed protein product [Triticum turgidum subsp. durum]